MKLSSGLGQTHQAMDEPKLEPADPSQPLDLRPKDLGRTSQAMDQLKLEPADPSQPLDLTPKDLGRTHRPPVGTPCSLIVTFAEPSKCESDMDQIMKKYAHEAKTNALRKLGMLTMHFGNNHPPCVGAWRDLNDRPGVLHAEFDARIEQPSGLGQ